MKKINELFNTKIEETKDKKQIKYLIDYQKVYNEAVKYLISPVKLTEFNNEILQIFKRYESNKKSSEWIFNHNFNSIIDFFIPNKSTFYLTDKSKIQKHFLTHKSLSEQKNISLGYAGNLFSATKKISLYAFMKNELTEFIDWKSDE